MLLLIMQSRYIFLYIILFWRFLININYPFTIPLLLPTVFPILTLVSDANRVLGALARHLRSQATFRSTGLHP